MNSRRSSDPGATPFTLALTTGNVITLDFTGATLAHGQVYYGGFFLNTGVALSMVSDATFNYVGIGGATVQFDGFVNVESAEFADGTVENGKVMKISVVPEPTTLALLGLSTALLAVRRRPGQR